MQNSSKLQDPQVDHRIDMLMLSILVQLAQTSSSASSAASSARTTTSSSSSSATSCGSTARTPSLCASYTPGYADLRGYRAALRRGRAVRPNGNTCVDQLG